MFPDELFKERYVLKHRIGKGSFGQVYCAYDLGNSQTEVAIKIIKSRRPFTLQAQSEIEILSLIAHKDEADEYNIVSIVDHFMHRNHQCLVFEMLSKNLYDLLKNTGERFCYDVLLPPSYAIFRRLQGCITQSYTEV